MPSLEDLRCLANAWVATGEWRPLHDALEESGYPCLAKHLTQEGCKVHRGDYCLVIGAIRNGRLSYWEREEKKNGL